MALATTPSRPAPSNRWNQSRAARYLGITRHTLLYRMDKHGIERPGSRGAGDEGEPKPDAPG